MIMADVFFKSEVFKELSRNSWWVQCSCQDYSSMDELVKKLDEISFQAELTTENSILLLKKVKGIYPSECACDFRNKTTRELNDNQRINNNKLFSFFAELKVFDELFNKNFTNIKFVEESDGKTPDLSAVLDKETFYIEVKRFFRPLDEDKKLWSNGSYSSFANSGYKDGLMKKVEYSVEEAKKKFNYVNIADKNKRILVIDYESGIDTLLRVGKDKRNLESIFGLKFWDDLEKSENLTIWLRKYFEY